MPEDLLPNQENQNLDSQGSTLQDPNPPVVKNEKPADKSPILKFILIRVIAGLIIAGLTGAYVFGKNNTKNNSNITISPAPTSIHDQTTNWETYYDSDFGISFKYPTSYGSVISRPSPSGKLLSFSVNKSISFGAYIKPEAENGGRSGTIFDLNKVTKIGEKYYWNMWFNENSKSEIEPTKIIKTQDGKEILLLNDDSFVESRGNEYKYLGGGTAAFLNLIGNKYTALVFRNSPFNEGEPAAPTPDPEFEQLLSTVKLITPVTSNSSPAPTSGIAVWEKYNDVNYPFSVEYPSFWILRTTYGKSVNNVNNQRVAGIDISSDISYGSTVIINIIDPKGMEFNEWVEKYSGFGQTAPQKPNYSYKGTPAYINEDEGSGGRKNTIIVYPYKDKVVYLEWHNFEND